MLELILGGVRSGKSKLAEQRALAQCSTPLLIATALPVDDEMRQRIEQHRQQRQASWQVIEEPRALGETLQHHADRHRYIVVDCLTLWLNNLLHDEYTHGSPAPEKEILQFLAILPRLSGNIIFINNETSMGVIPANSLSRRFLDLSGELNQQLGQLCERIFLCVAGHPLTIKDTQPLS